jgi:hypothetical protein
MALGTVTLVKKTVFGDLQIFVVDIQPTSGANYTTNGDVFGAAQLPGAPTGTILHVDCNPSGSVGGPACLTMWDPVNGKLKSYGTAGSAAGLTEIANNTDLSAQKVRAVVYFK